MPPASLSFLPPSRRRPVTWSPGGHPGPASASPRADGKGRVWLKSPSCRRMGELGPRPPGKCTSCPALPTSLPGTRPPSANSRPRSQASPSGERDEGPSTPRGASGWPWPVPWGLEPVVAALGQPGSRCQVQTLPRLLSPTPSLAPHCPMTLPCTRLPSPRPGRVASSPGAASTSHLGRAAAVVLGCHSGPYPIPS